MEKINKYKNLVEEELKYQQSIKIANGPNLKRHLVINESKTEFVLLDVGRFNKRYISGLVFHVEIKEGKVWIHEDNTDINIADNFARLGIPKSDIVLAFLPSYVKERTEYTVI